MKIGEDNSEICRISLIPVSDLNSLIQTKPQKEATDTDLKDSEAKPVSRFSFKIKFLYTKYRTMSPNHNKEI